MVTTGDMQPGFAAFVYLCLRVFDYDVVHGTFDNCTLRYLFPGSLLIVGGASAASPATRTPAECPKFHH